MAAGVFSDETSLTVKITVANNASIPQNSDSDPRYGLSDGNRVFGFSTLDRKLSRLRPMLWISGVSFQTSTPAHANFIPGKLVHSSHAERFGITINRKNTLNYMHADFNKVTRCP